MWGQNIQYNKPTDIISYHLNVGVDREICLACFSCFAEPKQTSDTIEQDGKSIFSSTAGCLEHHLPHR